MAKLVFVACLAVALLACCASAKKFSRCELVKELRKQGFPESKMRDWVCLVEHESGRDTAKQGPVNQNGSRDHGLFQINDRYWCSTTSKPGKDCNVTCADVRANNISKASSCAKKIYQRHQFKAWYGWLSHCQPRSKLPDISKC